MKKLSKAGRDAKNRQYAAFNGEQAAEYVRRGEADRAAAWAKEAASMAFHVLGRPVEAR